MPFSQPLAHRKQAYPLICNLRTRIRPLVPVLTVLGLVGCLEPAPGETGVRAFGCDPEARLSTELHGAIGATLDWGPDDVACEGMPRPDDAGARLRFSGHLDEAGSAGEIALILGIPGLERGATGVELPTNVTLIDERSGRFFATAGTDGCWTDIDRHGPVAENEATYGLRGIVYCVSPLAELGGTSSVTFTELQFTGRLDWEPPE